MERANRPIIPSRTHSKSFHGEKKLLEIKLTLQHLDKEETYVVPMKCGSHQNQKVEVKELMNNKKD